MRYCILNEEEDDDNDDKDEDDDGNAVTIPHSVLTICLHSLHALIRRKDNSAKSSQARKRNRSHYCAP